MSWIGSSLATNQPTRPHPSRLAQNPNRNLSAINAVALHIFGNSAAPFPVFSTVQQVINWIERQGTVGYHYVILNDGTVVQTVSENQIPNSTAGVNTRVIAIAMLNLQGSEPFQVSDLAITSCVNLMADIAVRHNFGLLNFNSRLTGNVLPHRTVVRELQQPARACPGNHVFNLVPSMVIRANNLITEGEEEEMTVEQVRQIVREETERHSRELRSRPPSTWAKEIWERLTKEGITDGTAPQGNMTRQEGLVLIDRVITALNLNPAHFEGCLCDHEDPGYVDEPLGEHP